MGQSTAVRVLAQETNGAIDLRKALVDHGDDVDLILTAIEGETNFNEAIGAVYSEVLEDEILLDGLGTKIEELTKRQQRIKQSIETRKNIILMAMERANVPMVKTSLVTISKRATPGVAVIDNESLIPATFWEKQDPKLNKVALNAALKDGGTIPGVSRSNGGITLSFRKV
ncbi:siphovirus Gp157 family protein [Ferrovibrio terrae]|uniref:siphovirus Gp157 family protein n=1 Tax=Ferrovibrio terrae TaxID=2594003 RepID=UPI003137A84A